MGWWLAGVCALAAVAVSPAVASGQEIGDEEAEAQAVAVIEQLFDAMRAADSATVRKLFADEMTQFGSSSTSGDGTPAIGFTSKEQFVGLIGGAAAGALDEQIIIRDVMVDDNMVTVVTPYEFYFDGNFSHCGVDVFVIARTGDGWKIVSLVDTRRRAGCEGWLNE
jgi:hypothetical protein